MGINRLISIVTAALVMTAVVGAQRQNDHAAADAVFVQKAAMGGMAEVEYGKIASSNAASADVRRFGERMLNDHGKAGAELKSLAVMKKLTVPTELDQEHAVTKAELSGLKGMAFDRVYMQQMVMAHEQTVMLMQTEIKNGKDAEIKAWTQKTLPTVQEHLRLARELSSQMH